MGGMRTPANLLCIIAWVQNQDTRVREVDLLDSGAVIPISLAERRPRPVACQCHRVIDFNVASSLWNIPNGTRSRSFYEVNIEPRPLFTEAAGMGRRIEGFAPEARDTSSRRIALQKVRKPCLYLLLGNTSISVSFCSLINSSKVTLI